MDIMMPEMDGITAMREIRKRRSGRSCPSLPSQPKRCAMTRRSAWLPVQRLHRKATGCREADVTGTRLDAEVAPVSVADVDIELNLLIDAIYLKYHYDFRRMRLRH